MAADFARDFAVALRPLASASNFDELAQTCAAVAAGRKHPADASKLASAAGVPDSCQTALVALFLEAARSGGASDDLAASLAAALGPERAAAVAALAAEGSQPTRAALDALSLGPDSLVDVTWQRATVAAAGGEQPRPGGGPLYTVTLTTRAPDGATKPVIFTATIEQLNDLVGTLKAAVRQVESECS